jgi:hypothetical protein
VLRALSRSTAALSLLGPALLSAPAFANDLSEEGDFGGTYSYIGPGVAALRIWISISALGAGVYIEPGVAFMSPGVDYSTPVVTWAPAYPKTLEVVARATDIDVGPAVVGADAGK